MAIVKTSRKLHKWLMLFVGTQLLIWAATGSYMVVMDIDYIHGDSLVTSNHQLIDANQVQFTLANLRQQYPNAEQISLKMLQGKAVYQFKLAKKWQLIAAQTGELLPSISKTQAISIAKRRYTGKGEILSSSLLTKANGEISPRILPAWKISFDDFAAPRLYISAQTGELVTKRHDFWVLFDWLYRFHIMDYGDEEDAGNRLLMTIALISLLASVTGVVLTYVSFVKVRGKSIQTPTNKSARRFMPWVRFLHRWLSLLVFTQLILWLSTGLYFNLMDHKKASGNQYRQSISQTTNQLDFSTLKPLNQVLAQLRHEEKVGQVEKVELITRLNKPYYLLTLQQGLYAHFPRSQQLVSAESGAIIHPDNKLVDKLAQLSYSGKGKIQYSNILTPPIIELPKQQNPLWQVSFNDKLNTSVYIDAQNASIVGHVDDDKRLADFMFKLHFMDYKILSDITGSKVGSFNNAQIIFFALLTLLFSLTGVYWLACLVSNGKMNRPFRW